MSFPETELEGEQMESGDGGFNLGNSKLEMSMR